jgi:hypothetical protein
MMVGVVMVVSAPALSQKSSPGKHERYHQQQRARNQKRLPRPGFHFLPSDN